MPVSHIERVDDSGVVERFAFFGPDDERLAGTTHIPPGPIAGTVLMCSGVLSDGMKNYRTEVILSRRLGSMGIAVQRFQYRGTGNSDGSPEQLGFDSMLEDAELAARHLEEQTGSRPGVLIGSRLGAFAAIRSAAVHDESRLVLIEPVLSAASYFRQGFRARMVSTVTEEGKARMTAGDMLDELTAAGTVDMVGFTLSKALYESAGDLTLATELEKHDGPVLIVQLSAESAGPLERLTEDRQSGGRPVELMALEAGESWWFIEDGRVADDQRQVREDASAGVAEWIRRQLG